MTEKTVRHELLDALYVGTSRFERYKKIVGPHHLESEILQHSIAYRTTRRRWLFNQRCPKVILTVELSEGHIQQNVIHDVPFVE
jgi:hypothetical protein